MRIVPGRYEVRFDWQAGSVSVPRNCDPPVQRGLELTSTQTLNVNVATIVVSPSFTLDGAPLPAGAGERGDFVLQGLAGGEVGIGTSNDSSPASVRTIREIYSIEYDWDAGFVVPGNVGHRLGVLNVPEPSTSAGFVVGGLLLSALAHRRA